VAWIKASDCRIIDTWDTAGLRATGSNDIEVSDVFVPKHRTSPVPLVDPVADGALFRFPIVGLFAVGMAASALGIAQCDKPETLQSSCAKPRYRPATSMDCKLAEGMVIFFESYERELEKYWTKTLVFRLS
jgi:hypothetical protein